MIYFQRTVEKASVSRCIELKDNKMTSWDNLLLFPTVMWSSIVPFVLAQPQWRLGHE